MKDKAFNKAQEAIIDLLNMYEVNTGDPEVQQNILNASVYIENAFKSHDL